MKLVGVFIDCFLYNKTSAGFSHCVLIQHHTFNLSPPTALPAGLRHSVKLHESWYEKFYQHKHVICVLIDEIFVLSIIIFKKKDIHVIVGKEII